MQTGTSYLESGEVSGKEVIGRAPTPIHNMLVLAAAAQFTIPVGDTKIGLHKCLAHRAIANHSVEEWLRKEKMHSINTEWLHQVEFTIFWNFIA